VRRRKKRRRRSDTSSAPRAARAPSGSRGRLRRLERLQGKWRFQILLRAAERAIILSMLEQAIPERPPSGTQVAVDVDPQDLM
jgi:primosomal protein N'